MEKINAENTSEMLKMRDNSENLQAENCEKLPTTETSQTTETNTNAVNQSNHTENEPNIISSSEDNSLSHDKEATTSINQRETAMDTETIESQLSDRQQEQPTSVGELEKTAAANVDTSTQNAKQGSTIPAANVVEASTTEIVKLTKIKTEPIANSAPSKTNEINYESFATVVVKSEPKKPLVGATNFVTKSSLGLLAEYNSESDEDENEDNEIMEVANDAAKDYRNKIIEIHSESESESSSSSDSEVEYIAKIRKDIEKSYALEDDEDAEDDDDDETTAGDKSKKKKAQNSMRVKGELGLEDLPPIQDLQITVPEDECIILGKIHSIVEQLVLVSALPDSTLYDLDTVLFLDKGKRVLGEVFDVLGQVADPLYCVRFNSHKEIEEKSIKVGDAVYVAPKTEHTQFVILSSLMNVRGSDASWENDVEPPPRYLDYSDDEQEREARQRLRNKDRVANKEFDDHEEASKRARDDNEDDTASVSSMSTVTTEASQSRRPQSGRGGGAGAGRFNRGNDAQQRSPRYNNNQRSPQQMPRNPNAGSWHSNYHHRPYSFNQPPMTMPPMPYQMNQAPYPMFPQYPTNFMPPMTPPTPPQPNMYLPNPYAMRPPQLEQMRSHSQQAKPRSPSPPPPGLE